MNYKYLRNRQKDLAQSINSKKEKTNELWKRYRKTNDDQEKYDTKVRIDSLEKDIEKLESEIKEIDNLLDPDDTIPTTQRIQSSYYDILSLNVNWNRNQTLEEYPSSTKIALLLINIQKTYDIILSTKELPQNYIEVSLISHPNATFNFKGLGEPIDALKNLIKDIPEIIVSLCTIPTKIKNRKAKIELSTLNIETNLDFLRIVKEYSETYWKIDKEKRETYLKEYVKSIKHDFKLPSTDMYIKVLEEEQQKIIKRNKPAERTTPKEPK